MLRKFFFRLPSQAPQEVPLVQPREPGINRLARSREVIRSGDRDCRPDLLWSGLSLFAKPLQHHVPTQRNTGKPDRPCRLFLYQPTHHEVEVRGFSGVVSPPSPIQSAIARPEQQHPRLPAFSACNSPDASHVMGPHTSFQAVQEQEDGTRSRRHRRRQGNLVAVVRRYPLEVHTGQLSAPDELPTRRDGGRVWEPPRGTEGIDHGGYITRRSN